MTIPEKINICGHEYEVLFPHSFSERGDLRGQADFDMHKIRLSGTDSSGNKYPESLIKETFLHELIHCADHYSGHRIFDGKEKKMTGLCNVLYHILSDNKLI